jgi:Flp pilus assembly protein TadB
MDAEQQKSLQWLGDQHFEEQRALRASEDNLFNWATSVFLAALGALTTLRGVSDASWGILWRLLVMAGVVGIDGVILLMAYLIRRNYERNQAALAEVMDRLKQTGLPGYAPARMDNASGDRLYFYLRWSAVGALGLIALVLVWLLG